MSVSELLKNINREDKTVSNSVEHQIPQIEKLINVIVPKMKNGGRLFYLGIGTSGRLGIIDFSRMSSNIWGRSWISNWFNGWWRLCYKKEQ